MEEFLDSILDLLNSPDAQERRRGIFLLAAAPEDTSVLLINNIAEYDESPALRFFARRVLASIANTFRPEICGNGVDGFIGRYIALAGDKDKISFIETGLPEDLQSRSQLLNQILLHEKSPAAAARAIVALGETGNEADIRQIVSFNGDNRPDIRRAVFDALAGMNNIKAFPFLTQFIIDDNIALANDSRNFFRSIDGALAVKIIKYMRSSTSGKMKAAAALAAGYAPGGEMFAELKALLESDSAAVRKAALDSLNKFLAAGVAEAVEYASKLTDLEPLQETLFDIKNELEFDNYLLLPAPQEQSVHESADASQPQETSGTGEALQPSAGGGGTEIEKPEDVNAEGLSETSAPPARKLEPLENSRHETAGGPAGESESEAEIESESVLFPLESGMKFGYIDKKGKLVIPFSFERAYPFANGFAAVLNGIRWGYINRDGGFTIGAQFEEAYNFSCGLARVLVAQKYGFINDKGHMAVKAQFEDAKEFSEGLAAVKQEGKWNFINTEGKTQFKNFDFERVSSFKNGLAMVRRNKKFGFVNTKGELAVKCSYEGAEDFSEELAGVKVGSRHGYIDRGDRFAIKPQFDRAREFSEGLAAVEIEKLYGFINKAGRLVITSKFEYASSFSEGLAAVKTGELWGYINADGTEAIEARFDEAGPFVNGLACVKTGGAFNYIDNKGSAVYGSGAANITAAAAEIIEPAGPHKEINKNASIPAGTVHAVMQKLGYPISNWKSTRSGHQPPPRSAEFYFLKASSGMDKSFNYADIMELIEAVKREHFIEVANGLVRFLENNYSA